MDSFCPPQKWAKSCYILTVEIEMVVAVAPNGPKALLGKRCASRHKQNPERDQATTEL